MLHIDRQNRKKRNPLLGFIILTVTFLFLGILNLLQGSDLRLTLLAFGMVLVGMLLIVRHQMKSDKEKKH